MSKQSCTARAHSVSVYKLSCSLRVYSVILIYLPTSSQRVIQTNGYHCCPRSVAFKELQADRAQRVAEFFMWTSAPTKARRDLWKARRVVKLGMRTRGTVNKEPSIIYTLRPADVCVPEFLPAVMPGPPSAAAFLAVLTEAAVVAQGAAWPFCGLAVCRHFCPQEWINTEWLVYFSLIFFRLTSFCALLKTLFIKTVFCVTLLKIKIFERSRENPRSGVC